MKYEMDFNHALQQSSQQYRAFRHISSIGSIVAYRGGAAESSQSRSTARPRQPQHSNETSSYLQDLLQSQKQLGAWLLGAGLLLSALGVMLFFEANLLRLGNVCIIAGVLLLIGPNRISSFFLKESRIQSTIITSIGILLVFTGRPKIGLIVEVFGLLNLFGNMLPMLLAMGKKMPVVGDLLSAAFDSPEKTNGRARRQPNQPRGSKLDAMF